MRILARLAISGDIFCGAGDYRSQGRVASFETSLHGTKNMNHDQDVKGSDNLLRKSFGDEELRLLQSLQYKTQFAVKQLARATVNTGSLDSFLMNIALNESTRLNEVMVKHDGDPSGIEFRNHRRDAWAVVLKDASVQGRWRVQYMDRDGMISHFGALDLQSAVEEMLSEGYVIDDQGAVDALCQTERWKRGIEIASLMQQLNSGQITHDEYTKMALQTLPA